MITETQRRALFALRETLHLCDEAGLLIYARAEGVRVCNNGGDVQFGTTSRNIWLEASDVDRLLAEHPDA